MQPRLLTSSMSRSRSKEPIDQRIQQVPLMSVIAPLSGAANDDRVPADARQFQAAELSHQIRAEGPRARRTMRRPRRSPTPQRVRHHLAHHQQDSRPRCNRLAKSGRTARHPFLGHEVSGPAVRTSGGTNHHATDPAHGPAPTCGGVTHRAGSWLNERLHPRVVAVRASLEEVRTQEPHFLLVESSLHPAQHDVVDALLVPQFEQRLTPPAEKGE